MKNILALLKKDLLRDLRYPWGILILMCIPLLMGTLMAWIFGGGGEAMEQITVHVAVLDRDDDFFGGMLRSMSSQGESDRQMQMHLVETEEEGIQLLEDREASAFLIFPENLTRDLIDGATTTIRIYTNPAESVLPRVVEEGAKLIASVLSEGLKLVGPQMKEFRTLIDSDTELGNWEYALVTYRAFQKMDSVSPYLFPPLITYEAVKAEDYIPSVSRVAEATEVALTP